MGKELEELEEGPKANIHPDLLRAILKKVPSWKTSGPDDISRIIIYAFRLFSYGHFYW